MKIKVFPFICLIMLFFSVNSFSQDINKDLKFDITIKDLVKLSSSEINSLSQSKAYVIIEGAVMSHTALSREESPSGNTEVIIDLINGEWVNDDYVEMFKVKIKLTGDKWEEYFPASRKEVTEKSIIRNTHLLVLCQVDGFYGDTDIPLLSASDIRIIP